MVNPVPKSVLCKDINGNDHRVDAAQLQWRPSAYGVVPHDGNILVSKQFGKYGLPGGGIELGETPEQAVIRETREETGIVVANPRLLTAVPQFFAWINDDGSAEYYQVIQLYYSCDFRGGEFSTAGFDAYEKVFGDMPEWYPLKDLDVLQCASTYDWRAIVTEAVKAAAA